MIDGFAAGLFRAHVSRRANHTAGLSDGSLNALAFSAEDLGQAEVQHLDFLVWRYLDVAGLEVSMDDTFLVRR
ncbi:hypothetical protein ES703_114556 [subsurface metagenome]